MVSVMSSPHDDNHDNGSVHESNSQVKSMSSSNIRRRHNAGIATNGEYRLGSPERKHDGESGVNVTAREAVHAMPKSLTPFVHIQNTDAIDAALDAYNSPSRSPSPEPNRQGEDEEAQFHQNRTISYDHEKSLHASFLTADSISNAEFNNSRRSVLSNDCGQRECSSRGSENVGHNQNGKTLQDPPSVGDENAISFRRENISYDRENKDDLSKRSGIDSSSSSEEITPSHRTLYAKFQRSRRIIGKIVNNEFVQLSIIFLIILNGILMGFSTTDMSCDARTNVEIVDEVFLWIFTIEIICQFYYFGFALFRDSWLVFDLIVVVISHLANMESFKVVRAFRIFRAFRLVTRVRPLRDLVLALGVVLPRMSAIVLLLLVTFYVFAVLFTVQFHELELESYYFTTLQDSFLSCFQMMTMEWADICREIMQQEGHKYAWISIVSFVMIAGFIVFNLIVAVVVEAVSATEETVRRLDGIESNTPTSQLVEAQERVDLLQSHLNEMMEQQEQIQFMLETMAGELLHLETERMKAKYRENRLREEINRRIEYEKKIEEESTEGKQPNVALKSISMQFLQKIEAQKAQRKQQEEDQLEALQALLEHDSVTVQSAKKKKAKRITSSSTKPGRDGSGKSIGSNQSADSNISNAEILDAASGRKKSDSISSRGTSHKGKSVGKEEPKGPEFTERKVKAINNWKKLLAVNKEFDV